MRPVGWDGMLSVGRDGPDSPRPRQARGLPAPEADAFEPMLAAFEQQLFEILEAEPGLQEGASALDELTEQDQLLPMIGSFLDGKVASTELLQCRDPRPLFLRGVLHLAAVAHPLVDPEAAIEELLRDQERRYEEHRGTEAPWTLKAPGGLFDRLIAHLVRLVALVRSDRNDPARKAELAADAANYVMFYLYRLGMLELVRECQGAAEAARAGRRRHPRGPSTGVGRAGR